ncbi:MAG: GFA family protein [Gammaproteobacteria bacterium]|nr:GFA family protein [Gammaproteobacteria bacterium]
MHLDGSCHCRAVKFSVDSKHPYPYNICYCSICRKTAGGGGYAINISASFNTLKISGEKYIQKYSADILDTETGENKKSPAQRSFCKTCGSALWLWDPRWPELLHPHASAIDTELPVPPEHTHLMLASKSSWAKPNIMPGDQEFEEYPTESIAAWHERLNL